ncbi:MAG: hypothetical protein ABR543_01810 [Gemmatimonadaceae bacterium]
MSVVANIGWGVKAGLLFGAIFCCWTLLLILVSGSLTLHTRTGVPVHAFAVIGVYIFGGLSAGAVVGICRPLIQWLLGATIVGIIAAIPVFVGVRIARSGFSPWVTADTAMVTIAVVVMGGFIGLGYWAIFFEKASKSKNNY